jgi:NitT/TauT family transport system substrate-binding protein
MLRILAATFLLFLSNSPSSALAAEALRIGTLAFGTLNWELAIIQAEGLDKAENIAIATTPLAGPDAGRIALQGGSVDLVVGDWLWVAQQRLQGHDFSFSPYSANHGALVVPAASPIKGVADLPGKRLGIAGGGLDKNWLLLRALGAKSGLDLDKSVEQVFGAPPLLAEEFRQGKLDAVLTYWNYAARLEAQGYRKVLDGRGILQGLGIEANVPALGYVFREAWANGHSAALAGFFRAADQAKRRICEADAAWAKVAPLTQETDEKIQAALRRSYCEGRVASFGDAEKKAAGEIFVLVAKTGGNKAEAMPAGVFWTPAR